MTNRFTQAFVPGSVFKTITGAIGLETTQLNPKKNLKSIGFEVDKRFVLGKFTM